VGRAGGLPAGLAVALLVGLVDQLSKWWILVHVMDPPRVIPVTPFFNLVLGWNRGISFGLLGGTSGLGTWLLVGLALAIVVVLGVWLRRSHRALVVAALGLIIGGALGNIVDRLRFGAVADFLDVHAAGYHWPAFNAADAGITVGAAMLILDSLFMHPEKNKNGSGKNADDGP
jgi:signal peptidase II